MIRLHIMDMRVDEARHDQAAGMFASSAFGGQFGLERSVWSPDRLDHARHGRSRDRPARARAPSPDRSGRDRPAKQQVPAKPVTGCIYRRRAHVPITRIDGSHPWPFWCDDQALPSRCNPVVMRDQGRRGNARGKGAASRAPVEMSGVRCPKWLRRRQPGPSPDVCRACRCCDAVRRARGRAKPLKAGGKVMSQSDFPPPSVTTPRSSRMGCCWKAGFQKFSGSAAGRSQNLQAPCRRARRPVRRATSLTAEP